MKSAVEAFVLVLPLDIFVVWFFLNLYSKESWDDSKLKIVAITISLSAVSTLIVYLLEDVIGPLFGPHVAVLAGAGILKYSTKLHFGWAYAMMASLIAYRIVLLIALSVFCYMIGYSSGRIEWDWYIDP